MWQLSEKYDFYTYFTEWYLGNETVLKWTRPHWWLIYIGSSNGLVLPGNKSLLEPSVDPDLCRHMAICRRKTSNISRTLIGNKIVDHSDVVGASPVGSAPTTSSFST